jgi:integrase
VPPINPAARKREEREADTIGSLAALYMTKAKKKKRSWKSDQRILDTIVLKAWRGRPVATIARRDVRELVESVNGGVYPNRVRALLFTMFNFAVERDIVDVNPVAGTKRPGAEQSRDRVLSEEEIRAFWAATETLPPVMAAVFRLRLLTLQRGGEVIHMRWQDLDLPNALWTIPAQYSKNKLPHRVPLSSPALDILKALRADVDARLAVSKHPKPPIFVLRGARGTRLRGAATKTFGLADFRGHDLRRTAATLLASSGTSETVIAKILNHQDRGVTKIYVRSGYDAEKKIALDQWARQLAQILDSKDGANVVPFARG